MKILYLGYFCSRETFRSIENAGLSPAPSRQLFEKSLFDSLVNSEYSDVELEIVSYLPKNNKIKELKAGEYDCGKYIHYIWTSRSNPFEIISANIKVRKLIKKWLKKTKGEQRIILTYAANPVLLAFCPARKQGVKIITICSEVPAFRNMTEGNRVINSLKKKFFSFFNGKMDGFIYMSKHMNETCNPLGKPYTVVEGMTTIIPYVKREDVSDNCEIVFYAGGVHVENGIDILLEAFNLIKDKNVTLFICGEGNAVDLTKKYASNNEKIRYLGVLPNEEVRKLEREATLLINPRKPDKGLTRYSFPSKTFEYFLSGTACIMTRLDGIPEEFYDYCYTCDVSNAEILARDISRVLSISKKERENMAKKAYEFIISNKSPAMQTKKIIVFLKELA